MSRPVQLWCVFTALSFGLLLGCSEPVTSRSTERTVRGATVRGTFWCANNFDDAGEIGIAVTRGDTAAVQGMLTRGRAFQVEKGTLVTGGEVGMGISLAHVESGFQTGQKCYISTNALE
jgi:hypothetical protein